MLDSRTYMESGFKDIQKDKGIHESTIEGLKEMETTLQRTTQNQDFRNSRFKDL
jgi:hypothetical protein